MTHDCPLVSRFLLTTFRYNEIAGINQLSIINRTTGASPKTFFGRVFGMDYRPHQLELHCSLRNENVPTKSVSSIYFWNISLSPSVVIKSQYSSINLAFLYSFELYILQRHRKVTAFQFPTTDDKDRRSACPYSLTNILNHHSNQRVYDFLTEQGMSTLSTHAGNMISAERKLVGFDNFKRSNPRSDKFEMHCFHHVEFYCSDSTNVSRRFSYALGMPIVASSNVASGNYSYSSTVMKSNSLCFVFTAPYGVSFSQKRSDESSPPHPGYDVENAHNFVRGKCELLYCKRYEII
jgi:hypothetical protein